MVKRKHRKSRKHKRKAKRKGGLSRRGPISYTPCRNSKGKFAKKHSCKR